MASWKNVTAGATQVSWLLIWTNEVGYLKWNPFVLWGIPADTTIPATSQRKRRDTICAGTRPNSIQQRLRSIEIQITLHGYGRITMQCREKQKKIPGGGLWRGSFWKHTVKARMLRIRYLYLDEAETLSDRNGSRHKSCLVVSAGSLPRTVIKWGGLGFHFCADLKTLLKAHQIS